MKSLIVEAPLNSLSFGNVSFNILRELYKLNFDIGLFPIGNVDLSTFKVSEDFKQYLQRAIDNRYSALSHGSPSLKLWHFSGGEDRKSHCQNLFTFYECSEPTDIEVAIAKSQNKVIVTSNYALDLFKQKGCDNFVFAPLGFDQDFQRTDRTYLKGVTHFGLMGKFEKRKNTAGIIKAWLEKYGNNNKYQLTCCITNPFFKPEQMNEIINGVLGGKRYSNINFLPYLKTNQEVNELLNAIDIDLTGLSYAEGWNLPSFNATCLGKWSIVSNSTSHKDWATDENAILVECDSFIDSHDGAFFTSGHSFNQGPFPAYSDQAITDAFDRAEKRLADQPINTAGIKLGERLTYANTVQKILESFS
jgi:hypothetical protein